VQSARIGLIFPEKRLLHQRSSSVIDPAQIKETAKNIDLQSYARIASPQPGFGWRPERLFNPHKYPAIACCPAPKVVKSMTSNNLISNGKTKKIDAKNRFLSTEFRVGHSIENLDKHHRHLVVVTLTPANTCALPKATAK